MYVRVTVIPKAKRETMTVVTADRFMIAVKEPDHQNAANQRVREMIAEHFTVMVGQVRIVTGHHAPTKMLDVTL